MTSVTDGPQRSVNVVEENIEEGDEAETINLKAYFQPTHDTYNYEIADVKSVVQEPPAFVKITKVPTKGKIVVKKMGEWVVLNKGDLIESSMLEDFIYDQGESVCSLEDQTRCDDEFSYVPYGEWVGYGEYQKTEINITPVIRDASVSV